MSTRANLVRRGTGTIKVNVSHNGPEEIRTNLQTSLFGTTGEKEHHILEIREFLADITEPCLTVPKTKQPLFRVFGRHDGVDVRDINGVFIDDYHFLGERVLANHLAPLLGSDNNDGIVGVPEDEFTFYVPVVYSVQELVWKINKKCVRINEVLHMAGWSDELTMGVGPGQPGLTEGGFGTASYKTRAPIIPNDSLPYPHPAPLLECVLSSGGLLGFKGSALFWNSFGIWVSPYMRQITGMPELLVRTGNVFGEAVSVDPANGEFRAGNNTTPYIHMSNKTLYTTVEERESCLVTSDIPVPHERVLINGEDTSRFVLGHFDIRGTHKLMSGRDVSNLTMENSWYLEGSSCIARQIMDPTGSTGYCSLVLPGTVPSFNIRIMLRRKQWDFTTNKYNKSVEIPLLKTSLDCMILRLLFTLQQ